MAEIVEEKQEVSVENPKTNKEVWMENIKKKYPEKDFANEDDLYSASMEGYDKDHEWMKKAKSDNQYIGDRLRENPDVADFIAAIVDGKPTKEAVEHLRDIYEAETQEDYDARLANRKQAEDEKAKNLESYEKNLQESAKEIENFASETGRSEEEVKAFVEQVTNDIFQPLVEGRISKDLLTKLDNMYNRDADIEDAKKSAYVKGKNEKIVDGKLKRGGDGLPSIKGGSSTPKESIPQDDWLAQLGAEADKRNKIWGH